MERNTYERFDLEPGVPTDAYELDTAVQDGYLVPPRVQQVDVKFPREGIAYDDPATPPERVHAAAINHWLFNRDTVDRVLQHLMEHGHRVAGGDRLAKTIVFARNHDHAAFIEARFNGPGSGLSSQCSH